jgi:hypothetical protein
MRLKNFLIVVKDIERAKRFYHDLFGFEVLVDFDGNMILTDGLVLQEEKYWKEFLKRDVIPENNSSELYFEESDIEAFDVVLAVGADPLSGVCGFSRRVMVLSPSREEQAVLGALERGINQYLSLPVEPCRLRRKLRPTR